MLWFKRRKTEHNTDRRALIEQDERDINFILSEWDSSNKLLLAIELSTLWRLFLEKHGTANEFERMPRYVQMQYLRSILKYSEELQSEAERFKTTDQNKFLESLSASYAARFLGSYVICLIEGDSEWEKILAPKLDSFMELGWAVSFSSVPMQSDQNYFPITEPLKPHTLFFRESR